MQHSLYTVQYAVSTKVVFHVEHSQTLLRQRGIVSVLDGV